MLRNPSLGHSIGACNQYLQINITQIPSSLHCHPQPSLPTWDSGKPMTPMFYCNDPFYILISKKQIGGILLVTFLVWPMKPLGWLIYGFLKRKLRSKVIDDRNWAERVCSQRNILRSKKEATCFVFCFVLFFSFWDSNKEIWSNFDFSEWEPKTAKVVKTLQGYVGGAKECVS